MPSVEVLHNVPSWASKYIGSNHHTDRFIRTVVGYEDNAGLRFPGYQETLWPTQVAYQTPNAMHFHHFYGIMICICFCVIIVFCVLKKNKVI